MKRCWIGAGFLLVLLIASLTVTCVMNRIHDPIEKSLNLAAEYAMQEDWKRGSQLFFQAKEDWDRWEHFRFSFADHTPVEEISAKFRGLEVYCAAREEEDFAAHCRELARKVAAVGEAHGISWWNIL